MGLYFPRPVFGLQCKALANHRIITTYASIYRYMRLAFTVPSQGWKAAFWYYKLVICSLALTTVILYTLKTHFMINQEPFYTLVYISFKSFNEFTGLLCAGLDLLLSLRMSWITIANSTKDNKSRELKMRIIYSLFGILILDLIALCASWVDGIPLFLFCLDVVVLHILLSFQAYFT